MQMLVVELCSRDNLMVLLVYLLPFSPAVSVLKLNVIVGLVLDLLQLSVLVDFSCL